MLRILLHGGSPCCAQPPDWCVVEEGGAWRAEQVTDRWPLREPWWSVPGARAPELRGAIHILIAWSGEGDLPSGPAEPAAQLVAALMEGYGARHPVAHHCQGRADTPGGLSSSRPPPLDCPPWELGALAWDRLTTERERIRAPLRRGWAYGGLGGGG